MDRLVSIEHYDVVLLGYRVTGTHGVQLVRLIRALEHRKTTAVIMVTSSAEVADEALAAGADEVLPKPIDPNSLAHAVERHIHVMEKRAS